MTTTKPGERMSWFDLSKVEEGAVVVFAEAWDIFPDCVIPAGTKAVVVENGLNEIWCGMLVAPGDQSLRDQLKEWKGCVHLGSHLDPGADAITKPLEQRKWDALCPLVLAPGAG